VLGCVVLICFVELSFIFVTYILLLKKSGCVVFLECSAPSCDKRGTGQRKKQVPVNIPWKFSWKTVIYVQLIFCEFSRKTSPCLCPLPRIIKLKTVRFDKNKDISSSRTMPNESKQHDLHTAVTSCITSKLMYVELVPSFFRCPQHIICTGNESVPKIMIHDSNFFLKVQSAFW